MSRSEAAARLALAGLAVVLGTSGCVENGLREATKPFDYAPIEAPPPPRPEPGAIWRGGSPSGSFLFFDQKARGIGDLVTVIIEEDVRAEGRAETSLARDGQVDMGLSSDVGLADLVVKGFRSLAKVFGLGTPGTAVAPGATANVVKSSAKNDFDGEGVTSRSGRFSGILTCRVVDVLPGKVFHIRGRRSLLVNHEQQFVTLEALLRQEDIGINNTVRSASLAEARLTMDGIGVVDDKQRPGWFGRVLDWVYPF